MEDGEGVMKKNFMAFLLMVTCSLSLVACDDSIKIEISREGIEGVTIYTQPHSDSFVRAYTSPEKIDAVIDYLSGLDLKDDFPESPEEYAGMAYIIIIHYEDGTQVQYDHYGNMFLGHIRDDTVDWYRMSYEEAVELDTVLQRNPSDE